MNSVMDSSQQKGVGTILEFGMRIDAPKAHNGIAVHAALIPLKRFADLGPLPGGKPVFIVFNLDIYGGEEGKKVAVGQGGFNPPITVYINYLGEGKMAADRLWYWIPETGWVPHQDLIKKPGGDTEVTAISHDAKGYFFNIIRWPTSDRMMASDG